MPKLTYEDAAGIVIDDVSPLAEVDLPVLEARGMVPASPLYARRDLPAADNSATTFELFVQPAPRRLQGLTKLFHPRLRVILEQDVRGGQKRERSLWGEVEVLLLHTPPGAARFER